MRFKFNKDWITHRIGLKIWALILAAIVWLYVNGELQNRASSLF